MRIRPVTAANHLIFLGNPGFLPYRALPETFANSAAPEAQGTSFIDEQGHHRDTASSFMADASKTAPLPNNVNYSLAVLSEGAEWEGYTVKEYGEADAFGHRKKMSVAEDLSNEIKNKTGEETIVSDLTYDLRSGSADFVDRMVASTFAGMALDAIAQGQRGLMTAISHGCYTMVGIPDPKLGPRRVEVASMYNTDRYRPTYDKKVGLPIFLTRA